MEDDIFAVYRMHDKAILPQRSTRHSVGYDLFATGTISIEPHSSLLVSTGIKILLPVGCFGKIESRSSLSTKNLIFTGAGVIDSDYTGELKILLINHSNLIVNIPYGKACAQLLLIRASFEQHVTIQFAEERDYLMQHKSRYADNVRLEKGFGSTDANTMTNVPTSVEKLMDK